MPAVGDLPDACRGWVDARRQQRPLGNRPDEPLGYVPTKLATRAGSVDAGAGFAPNGAGANFIDHPSSCMSLPCSKRR